MNFKFSNKLLIAFITLISAGYSHAIGTTTNNGSSSKTKVKLGANLDSVRPGKGYSTYMGELSEEQCYYAVGVPSSKSGKVDVTSEFGASSLKKSLGGEFSFGVEASNPFISINGIAKYVNEQSDSSLSSSLYYSAVINRKINLSVDQNQRGNDGKFQLWTPLGENQYERLRTNQITIQQFSTLCGDRMLSSYNETGAFIIKLTFEFDSSQENNQFQAEFKTKTLFTSTSTSFNYDSELSKYHGRVIVTAQQFGGQPEQLATIMSGSGGILTCNLNNLYTCDSLISSLLQYGQMFSGQFMNNGGEYKEGVNMIPSGGVTLGQNFSTYAESIPKIGIESELVKERNQIILDRERLRITQTFVDNTLSKIGIPSSTAPDYTLYRFLSNYKVKLDQIIKDYNSREGDGAISECWTKPENCKVIYNKNHAKLSKFKSYLIKGTGTTPSSSDNEIGIVLVDLNDTNSYFNDNLPKVWVINAVGNLDGKSVQQPAQPGQFPFVKWLSPGNFGSTPNFFIAPYLSGGTNMKDQIISSLYAKVDESYDHTTYLKSLKLYEMESFWSIFSH